MLDSSLLKGDLCSQDVPPDFFKFLHEDILIDLKGEGEREEVRENIDQTFNLGICGTMLQPMYHTGHGSLLIFIHHSSVWD